MDIIYLIIIYFPGNKANKNKKIKYKKLQIKNCNTIVSIRIFSMKILLH